VVKEGEKGRGSGVGESFLEVQEKRERDDEEGIVVSVE